MTKTEIVEKLVQETETNPIANAVFHVFALRRRNRSTLTITSLYYKMKQEGFDYPKTDYIPIMELLASLGFGELTTSRSGAVTGLKNIKIALQSIGAVACRQKLSLEGFNRRPKFERISNRQISIKKPQQVNLELVINGKYLHIPVPKEFDSEEITTLIKKLTA